MSDWQTQAEEYMASPPPVPDVDVSNYTEDIQLTPPLDLEPQSEDVQLGPSPANESTVTIQDAGPLQVLEGAIQQITVPEAEQTVRTDQALGETEFFQVNVMPEDYSGGVQSTDTGYQELLLGGE